MSLYCIQHVKIANAIMSRRLLIHGLSSNVGKSKATAAVPNAYPEGEKKVESAKVLSETVKQKIDVVIDPIAAKDFIETPSELVSDPSVVPFAKIPGPNSLFSFAKILHHMPKIEHKYTRQLIDYILSAAVLYIGSQLSWGRNLWLYGRMLTYGPVVRCWGPFGGDIVLLGRPEHAKQVLDSETQYPIRSFMDSLEKYRLENRKFKHAGPFLTFGENWLKLRKAMEGPLKDCVPVNFEKIQCINGEFINRIRSIKNRQDEVPAEFLQEINKWSLECFASVVLNKKVGFLSAAGLSAVSEPGRVLLALEGATKGIRKCEWGVQMYRVFKTPAWNMLVKNCNELDTILSRHIERAQDTLKMFKADGKTRTAAEMGVLDMILLKDNIDKEDALTILLDMMIMGVNYTSHTVAFVLYHLARSPRSQLKLFNEVSKLPEPLTLDSLKTSKYLQACIKETLRLKPPMGTVNRRLTKDMVIHNYSIRKGTLMFMPLHLNGLREEHFESALAFKPERWSSSDAQQLQELAHVPFGYGVRNCVARSLAETQIASLVVKVVKKYSIEYYHRDIESNYTMLAQPSRPLKLRFINRI